MRRDSRSVTVVREVPVEARALSTMKEPDYADMFSLASSAAANGTTALTLARAMYEDTLGARGQVIFGRVLGFELAPAKTPGTVAGWRVAEQGEDWIRMEAEGGRLGGQIVVRAADGKLSVATFIHYVNRLGAMTWTSWSIMHRQAMPGLLRNGAEIVER